MVYCPQRLQASEVVNRNMQEKQIYCFAVFTEAITCYINLSQCSPPSLRQFNHTYSLNNLLITYWSIIH